MKIVIADDEKKALHLLRIIIERYTGFQSPVELHEFSRSSQARDFLMTEEVDLAFLDIKMPGITGLEIAQELFMEKKGLPEIVFVTAYPQYSMTAWQLEVLGYVLKPYDPQQIYRLLDRAQTLHPVKAAEEIPRVICASEFNVFVDHKPIDFRHQKSRELLAFLVFNRGGWVSLDTIIEALLTNAEEKSSKNYCRIIAYRLKQTLEQAGIGRILETGHGKMRVIPEMIDCDFYHFRKGEQRLPEETYFSEFYWSDK